MSTAAEVDLGKMLQGRRAIGKMGFPGAPGIQIGVRLLSDREIDEARADAALYLQQRCKPRGFGLEEFVRIDPDALEREHERQVIVRAFVDPDSDPEKPRPFFASVEKVRDLDSLVVMQLWEHYTDWHDAVDPRVKLSDEQVDELIDALKKGPSEPAILAHLEPVTLRRLLRSTASRLAT